MPTEYVWSLDRYFVGSDKHYSMPSYFIELDIFLALLFRHFYILIFGAKTSKVEINLKEIIISSSVMYSLRVV